MFRYLAKPRLPNGEGVVVLHEAFGVTPFLRETCDMLAGKGYVAVAPDLFTHAGDQANNVLPQTGAGLEEGRQRILATPVEKTLADIAAAVDTLRAEGAAKVHVAGFCWGGSMTYLSALKLGGFASACSFYGGRLADLAAQGEPACPTQVHLATLDRYIPIGPTTAAFAAHAPGVEVFVYDADHGFCRHDGVTFDEKARDLAFERWFRLMESGL